MDIKALRELAQTYTIDQLNGFIDELENTGKCSCSTKNDPGDIMTDLLQAIEVRQSLDLGQNIQDAIREFSKRVRSVLS